MLATVVKVCGDGYEHGIGSGCKHQQFKSDVLALVHKLFPNGDALWSHIGRAMDWACEQTVGVTIWNWAGPLIGVALSDEFGAEIVNEKFIRQRNVAAAAIPLLLYIFASPSSTSSSFSSSTSSSSSSPSSSTSSTSTSSSPTLSSSSSSSSSSISLSSMFIDMGLNGSNAEASKLDVVQAVVINESKESKDGSCDMSDPNGADVIEIAAAKALRQAAAFIMYRVYLSISQNSSTSSTSYFPSSFAQCRSLFVHRMLSFLRKLSEDGAPALYAILRRQFGTCLSKQPHRADHTHLLYVVALDWEPTELFRDVIAYDPDKCQVFTCGHEQTGQSLCGCGAYSKVDAQNTRVIIKHLVWPPLCSSVDVLPSNQ